MDFYNIEINKLCSCGKIHSSCVEACISEKGAINRLPEIVGNKKAFVVSDANTYKAAGEKVCALLKEAGAEYSAYSFDSSPEPDERAIGSVIMHFDKNCDILIGVGSGVINDICKIVANVTNRKYVIVATAPSMDGYASATSSVIRDGLKYSLNSKCADIIIGDIDILKNAPEKMLKAGLGDMLAKYVSICEWRIANIITGEYYCKKVAELIRCALDKCVKNADLLLKRDEAAVKSVFDGLVLGGIAMNFAGVSRPASGVEHYISHIWDMRGEEFKTPVDLHGIQCAVGTYMAIRLYEELKMITPDKEKAYQYTANFNYDSHKNILKSFLGKASDAMIALEEKEHKYSLEKHRERLDIICDNRDKILKIINEELPPSEDIHKLLTRIDAPFSPSQLGIDEKDNLTVFEATRDIRDKYVLSRLAWDLGVTEELFKRSGL